MRNYIRRVFYENADSVASIAAWLGSAVMVATAILCLFAEG